jgi:hypothetical protein
LADIRASKSHVRFTFESGHLAAQSECPLSANGGHSTGPKNPAIH